MIRFHFVTITIQIITLNVIISGQIKLHNINFFNDYVESQTKQYI